MRPKQYARRAGDSACLIGPRFIAPRQWWVSRCAAVGLLACCTGLPYLAASSSGVPGMAVQRSTRTVPRRWAVHPDGATVAPNQSQRFEVTDTQGNPVAVHWNVSGIDCFEAACGTIDDKGVYHTPSGVPQARVITLEAVLVSNPKYSVLTQIRISPAGALPESSTGEQVAAATEKAAEESLAREAIARGEMPPAAPPVAAPVAGRRTAHSNSVSSPQLHAVEPAPSLGAALGRTMTASTREGAPLPPAVDAAPGPGRRTLSRNTQVPSLPRVVEAPPGIERTVVSSNNVSRNNHALAPLPSAVSAAPAVARDNIKSGQALPALPPAVSPAPDSGTMILARNAEFAPLPRPVKAAPDLAGERMSRAGVAPLQRPIASPPADGERSLGHSSELPLPVAVAAAPSQVSRPVPQVTDSRLEGVALPRPITPPPADGKRTLARSSGPVLPTNAVSAPPAVEDLTIALNREAVPLPRAAEAAPIAVNPNHPQRAAVTTPQEPAVALSGSGTSSVQLTAVRAQPILMAAAAPPPVQIANRKPDGVVAAEQGSKSLLRGPVLMPLAEEIDRPIEAPSAPGTHGPVVTYHDGELTIDVGDSTLADVLKLVAQKTGAIIDVPAGTGTERIFEHTGPGRADDVVARLLNGSAYDFVIVGSLQHPHELTEVLLSLHHPDGPASAPLRPAPPTSAALWTPPAEAPTALVLPGSVEDGTLTPPKDPIPPEDLGKIMLERAHQLREQLQQQQPQQ